MLALRLSATHPDAPACARRPRAAPWLRLARRGRDARGVRGPRGRARWTFPPARRKFLADQRCVENVGSAPQSPSTARLRRSCSRSGSAQGPTFVASAAGARRTCATSTPSPHTWRSIREPFRELDPVEHPRDRPRRARQPPDPRPLHRERGGPSAPCCTCTARTTKRVPAGRPASRSSTPRSRRSMSTRRAHAKSSGRGTGERLSRRATSFRCAGGGCPQDLVRAARAREDASPGSSSASACRSILKTRGADARDRWSGRPNRGLACGVYCVPYADGYCYIGATNEVSPRARTRPYVEEVRDLLTSAIEQVSSSLRYAEIHKIIVGHRPTTMDAFPLLGQTSLEGIWLASGTRRDGLHLSPKIADELRDRDRHRHAAVLLGAFVPERPLLLETPKAASPSSERWRSSESRFAARRPGSVDARESERRASVVDAYRVAPASSTTISGSRPSSSKCTGAATPRRTSPSYDVRAKLQGRPGASASPRRAYSPPSATACLPFFGSAAWPFALFTLVLFSRAH